MWRLTDLKCFYMNFLDHKFLLKIDSNSYLKLLICNLNVIIN